MDTKASLTRRHFVTYSGVALPLKLISPLEEDGLDLRITYFRGYFDDRDRLCAVEKVVYGEIEFEHRYEYYEDDRIKSAELIEGDEEPRCMYFD